MRYLRLAFLISAATPTISRAQGACADIPKFFAHPPTVGEWAEMSYSSKEKQEGSGPVRMAVIKTEHREGKPMYWFQMTMEEKGKRTIVQMLSPWDMNTMPGSHPVEVVMKMGDQPAMKMAGGMMGQNPSQADWREYCAKSKFVGEESVTVPAGTFKSRHYQSDDGDTWASLQAPVWHIVKMTTKDGKTMVLSSKGTGAKNEITEQPVDMSHMMADPAAAQKMKEEMEKNKQ